jgi:hypothetical protein
VTRWFILVLIFFARVSLGLQVQSIGWPTCSPTLLQSGGEDGPRYPVKGALLELRGRHVA